MLKVVQARGGHVAGAGRILGSVALGLTVASCSAASPSSPSSGSSTEYPAVSASPPSASPSAIASPAASPSPVVARAEETAVFAVAGTVSTVADVAVTNAGLIAVGTQFNVEALPNFGPVPKEGRIWASSDGRSWADVTPQDIFADADLTDVYVAADGGLVVLGSLTPVDDPAAQRAAAWESADGVAWTTSTNVPPGWVYKIVGGPKGYLAAAGPAQITELWYSRDGRNWSVALGEQPGVTWLDIGAGPEGFVGVSAREVQGAISREVFASSDGRQWFRATSSPEVDFVAPHGPDWVAITRGSLSDPETPVWFSNDGLAWEEIATIGRGTIGSGPDTRCTELAGALVGIGSWSLVSLTYSFPCSEGRVQTYGDQLLSVDARTWSRLELPPAVPSGGDSRGSWVRAIAQEGETLVLVGESDSQATFWLVEP